ncbi:polysaccharide deacetylase family protein [Streptomyces sp. NPDC001262]|uniref:polysaccharide deacetylase family protein n=1 Tax=unclassified Streptomyces TaxID=2593676 RepID=UPI00367BC48A
MARTTGRNRYIAIVAVSVVALSGVITGSLAKATEYARAAPAAAPEGAAPVPRDPDPAAPRELTPEPVATPTGSASAAPGDGPVASSITHDTEAGGRSVSITVDDGPDPVWTPKVLALLKKYDVKAVFCMIGPEARARPDLVRKVLADGHRLCDHSVDHNTAMDQRSESYQEQQVLDAQQMIEKAAGDGVPIHYYRAPGGAFTPYSRGLAAQHGMRPLGWSVDTRDWERPGVDHIVKAIEQGLTDGPIVLVHDGGGDRGQTVAALEQTIPWLKEHGYVFSFPKI